LDLGTSCKKIKILQIISKIILSNKTDSVNLNETSQEGNISLTSWMKLLYNHGSDVKEYCELLRCKRIL